MPALERRHGANGKQHTTAMDNNDLVAAVRDAAAASASTAAAAGPCHLLPHRDAPHNHLDTTLLHKLGSIYAAQRQLPADHHGGSCRADGCTHYDAPQDAKVNTASAAYPIVDSTPPPTTPPAANQLHRMPSASSSPPSPSQNVPFTDNEPLDWVVPPGVADVVVTDVTCMSCIAAEHQFTSVVSNASVVLGKWMYEVTLCSSGLLQLGWCGPMMLYPWTPRLGVGDFPFSVAFDGHRQQLWNVQATPCGHRWVQGDVVTCCLDLDNGAALFYQNGELVGRKAMLCHATAKAAHERVAQHVLGAATATSSSLCGTEADHNSGPVPLYDTTLSYSPAISLGQLESCAVNLGGAPFRYPVAGFRPMDVHGAAVTALWRSRVPLLNEPSLQPHRATVLLSLVQEVRASCARVTPPSSLLFQRETHPIPASHHWDAFAVMVYDALLVPLQGSSRAGAEPATLLLLSLVEMALTPDEWVVIAGTIASYAAFNAATRRLDACTPDRWAPSPELLLMKSCVTKHAAFRRAWAQSPLFFADFLNVFRIKTPNNYDLMAVLFPTSSDRTADAMLLARSTSSTATVAEEEEPVPTPDEAHLDHEGRSAVLHDCVVSVDDGRRLGILTALLDCPSTEDAAMCAIATAVSELRKLIAIGRQPSVSGMPPGHRPRISDVCIDSAVATRLFFALVCYITDHADAVRREAAARARSKQPDGVAHAVQCAVRDAFLPNHTLLDPLVEGVEFTRIGGSHASVLKAIAHLLPHQQQQDQQQQQQEGGDCRQHRKKSTLLSKCMILYSASVKELVTAACADIHLRHRQRDAWQQNLMSPAEVNGAAADIAQPQQQQQQQPPQSGRQQHQQVDRANLEKKSPTLPPTRLSPVAAERLLQDMCVTGRTCAWSMSTLFHLQCHEKTSAFCALVVEVLRAYDARPEYGLIPIVFVECFVDVWHFARKTAPQYPQLVTRYPQTTLFFVEHLLDPRVAHVETSEYLLYSLTGVLDTIEEHRIAVASVLSRAPDALMGAMVRLLRQFEHPLGWTLAVGVLTKFNIGNYFCLVDLEEESAEWNAAFPTRRAFVFGGSHQHTAPQAHSFYREFFARKFLANPDVARAFFKQLMTHSNWCVSELGVSLSTLLQHKQTTGAAAAMGPEVVAQRRRCGAIFELTRKVLHILEFTVEAAKQTYFTGGGVLPPAECAQNTTLLLELWTQTVTRFCTKDNALTDVIARGTRNGMEKVQQWKIMAPVVGILYVMLDGGRNLSLSTNNNVGNVFLRALMERQFTWPMQAIEHLLHGVDWRKRNCGVPWDKATPFLNPTANVLPTLRSMHASSKQDERSRLAEDDNGQVEEGTCGICMCKQADTVFVPCGHSSCIDCINRQMGSNGKCFWCNAAVVGLRPVAMPTPAVL